MNPPLRPRPPKADCPITRPQRSWQCLRWGSGKTEVESAPPRLPRRSPPSHRHRRPRCPHPAQHRRHRIRRHPQPRRDLGWAQAFVDHLRDHPLPSIGGLAAVHQRSRRRSGAAAGHDKACSADTAAPAPRNAVKRDAAVRAGRLARPRPPERRPASSCRSARLAAQVAAIGISITFGPLDAIPSSTAPAMSAAFVTRRAGTPIAAASARKSIGGSVMSMAMKRLARGLR